MDKKYLPNPTRKVRVVTGDIVYWTQDEVTFPKITWEELKAGLEILKNNRKGGDKYESKEIVSIGTR